jgi:hypothetical protein
VSSRSPSFACQRRLLVRMAPSSELSALFGVDWVSPEFWVYVRTYFASSSDSSKGQLRPGQQARRARRLVVCRGLCVRASLHRASLRVGALLDRFPLLGCFAYPWGLPAAADREPVLSTAPPQQSARSGDALLFRVVHVSVGSFWLPTERESEHCPSSENSVATALLSHPNSGPIDAQFRHDRRTA